MTTSTVSRRQVLMAMVARRGAVLPREDAAFLRAEAARMVAGARLGAGETVGKYRNTTRYTVRAPGGNMGYPAFWVRDAVMMLGAELVGPDEVEGWVRLMAGTLRGEDWTVREGVVVRAWTVPDHINFDGSAVFYPGTYDAGTKQGGKPFGKYPPLDDQYYFIGAVWEQWRLTGSVNLFRAKVGVVGGEMELAEVCERVYGKTGLVETADVDEAKDWGFCDTVFKSGKLLFPSVLKFVAAGQLAALFAAAGDGRRAGRFRAEAGRLKRAVAETFVRDDGWLRSATGVGNQVDVWGTAYAVWCGAVEGKVAERASRALVRGYREGMVVRDGLVRHTIGAWEKALAAAGTYQNGGYWGTPVGWYVAAMARTDLEAARAMAQEYVRWLRAGGEGGAWEWENRETGKRANPLYVATVALPYVSMKRAGLLGE